MDTIRKFIQMGGAIEKIWLIIREDGGILAGKRKEM
jgi:hypothetical protein